LVQEMRKHLQYIVAELRYVRFLRVQSNRAEMLDAELRGAKPLPPEQRVEVVDEAPDRRPRLTEPERRFDDRDDAGGGHRLVIVGGARGHVNVGIEDLHRRLPTGPAEPLSIIARPMSLGIGRPAAPPSAAESAA